MRDAFVDECLRIAAQSFRDAGGILRRIGKPRIRRLGPGSVVRSPAVLDADPQANRWVCEGRGHSGAGPTPQVAFERWRIQEFEGMPLL